MTEDDNDAAGPFLTWMQVLEDVLTIACCYLLAALVVGTVGAFVYFAVSAL